MARIVVVERDPRLLRVIVTTLQSRGHEVLGTTDNGAMIKAMRALSANLLIIDSLTFGRAIVPVLIRLKLMFPHMATILVSKSPTALLEAVSTLSAASVELVRTLQRPFRRAPLLNVVAEIEATQLRAERRSRDATSRANHAGRHKRRRVRTVLVVDTDSHVRRSIHRTLTRAGFRVSTAADGDKALTLVRRHRPDVAIVDIALPGKDGLTTIGEIRMMAPRTKVIAISGAVPDAPEANLPIASMLGASRSLRKPFRMTDLLATVIDLLANERPATTHPPRPPCDRDA